MAGRCWASGLLRLLWPGCEGVRWHSLTLRPRLLPPALSALRPVRVCCSQHANPHPSVAPTPTTYTHPPPHPLHSHHPTPSRNQVYRYPKMEKLRGLHGHTSNVYTIALDRQQKWVGLGVRREEWGVGALRVCLSRQGWCGGLPSPHQRSLVL